MPPSEDIDWVVELSGADRRQKSRLQRLVDKSLACDLDDGLFRIRQARGATFHCQAAALLRSFVFRQFQGSSSSNFWTGCSATRAKTSASQVCGSMSFILAVTIRLYITAARSPPRSEPQNNQDFLPRAIPRTPRSAALLDGQMRPRAYQQSGALPTLEVRYAECFRSSPRGRHQRLPGGLGTAARPP
jgi:hypothetical protein